MSRLFVFLFVLSSWSSAYAACDAETAEKFLITAKGTRANTHCVNITEHTFKCRDFYTYDLFLPTTRTMINLACSENGYRIRSWSQTVKSFDN